jgi:hypothetical protein
VIISGGLATNHHYISRISLDGSTRTLLYERTPNAAGEGFVGDMVTDGTNIYWSDYLSGSIQKMPLSGGPPVTLALGLYHPDDLLMDGTSLYVATGDGIKKLSITSGALTNVYSSGTGLMAKDGNNLYIAGTGMTRLDLLTGVATPLFGTGVIYYPPVVTNYSIYWIVYGSRYEVNYGRLERIPK